jgi:hypothetical protein
MLRRLTLTEAQLTLQDLFGLSEPPPLTGLPLDNQREGFSTFADVQAMSAQHLRAFANLARTLADALLADAPRRAAVVGCNAESASCLREFIARFGRLAHRGRLASADVERYATRAEQNALDPDDRIRYAVQALIASPYFVYRRETGDALEGLSTLAPNELASRLSFGLWGRAPNAALLDQAENGALNTPEGLAKSAESMLRDPRAAHFYTGFFRQWLGYDQLRSPNVRPSDFSDALLPEMQAETDAVVRAHAFGTGPFFDLLTADETTLTPALARYYGLPSPTADGRLTVPADHARAHAGILGHAAVLSMKTDGDRIAVRGNWLRRTFLCRPLSIPPQIAADLGDLLVGLSPVQIVRKRNTEAACKGCHALIDPIGVGLAHFDVTGRFDAKEDVTAYGIAPHLPDLQNLPFTSLSALAQALADAPETSACLSEKVFLFMHGRDPVAEDGCSVEAGHTSLDQTQRFPALVAGIVSSPAFRLRKAAAPSAAGASK